MMLCELCGKDAPFTRSVVIGGARLDACSECAKFGEERGSASSESSTGGNRAVIEQRLERRQRRMGTRDIYADAKPIELIEDYGSVIRKARESKGMDLDKFSDSINEKRGTIAKIETNDLIPDDKLAKKIERALDIKLFDTLSTGMVQSSGSSGGKMTLGDFLKK